MPGRVGRYRCSCGTEKRIRIDHVTSGRVLSCGCLSSDRTTARNLRHGNSVRGKQTAEYKIWCGLRRRCTDRGSKLWLYYGGRGISVAPQWLGPDGFSNFLRDVGTRPTAKHSLDRIDNNADYAPENVRWATRKEQMRNTRNNHLVPYHGQLLPMITAAELAGLSYKLVHCRVKKYGWSAERALSTPRRGS